MPVGRVGGLEGPVEVASTFLGRIDANRVQFSVGRDITLTPAQAGPALNYFIYPYVEVDGKPFTQVTKRFSFSDVNPTQVAASGMK